MLRISMLVQDVRTSNGMDSQPHRWSFTFSYFSCMNYLDSQPRLLELNNKVRTFNNNNNKGSNIDIDIHIYILYSIFEFVRFMLYISHMVTWPHPRSVAIPGEWLGKSKDLQISPPNTPSSPVLKWIKNWKFLEVWAWNFGHIIAKSI